MSDDEIKGPKAFEEIEGIRRDMQAEICDAFRMPKELVEEAPGWAQMRDHILAESDDQLWQELFALLRDEPEGQHARYIEAMGYPRNRIVYHLAISYVQAFQRLRQQHLDLVRRTPASPIIRTGWGS